MPSIADLIKADQEQVATVETPTTEASTTTVTPTGDLQNNAATTTETSAATTETETPAGEENVSSFSIPSFTEPTTTPAAPATEETKTAPNVSWQDAIKSIDKKEILKAVGVNDFALELNEYMANGGNPADYIAAKGVDWGKVSDAELIFDQLKAEYPDANGQQLQRIFNKKYNQTDLAEDEDREDGELQMKADARKIREAKIEKQKQFKMPEPIQQQQAEPDLEKIKLEAEKEQAAKFEKVKAFYESHEATKNLMNSKRVAVKLGDKGSFNFNIDKPELLTQLLLDGNAWQQVTSTPQGEPDVEKLQRIALVALNPNYETDILNYGISLGRKSLVEEGQNAKRPIGQNPGSDGLSKGLVVKGSGTLKQHMGN